MATPSVSQDQFNQALSKCVDSSKGEKRAKSTAYRDICRALSADLAEVSGMLMSGIGEDPDARVAGSTALSLTAMIYEAYRIAGATFTPISKEVLIGLFKAEEAWIAHLRTLPVQFAQESEEHYFLQRPNGEILKLAMDTLRILALKHQPENIPVWGISLERARLTIAAAHAAFNLSTAGKQ